MSEKNEFWRTGIGLTALWVDLHTLDKLPDRREPSEGSGAERGNPSEGLPAGMADLPALGNHPDRREPSEGSGTERGNPSEGFFAGRVSDPTYICFRSPASTTAKLAQKSDFSPIS
jgi:hypothetical protein